MPKKRSSVKASRENPVVKEEKLSLKPKKSSNEIDVVEDAKPSSKPKSLSNEIDEIFAGKKRKKPEGKKMEKLKKDESVEPKVVKKKKEKKKSKGDTAGGFANTPAQPRKRTEDGLTIYTEEELDINNADAGNTPLCPFDCSCCF